MLTIKAILEAVQAFPKPPKILTFDSPRQLAVAYSLLRWTNYACRHEKGYKELDLSTRKLPGLSSPTNRNVLELQVRTVLNAVSTYNNALYEQSDTGECISSNVKKVRAIAPWQEAIRACDDLLSKPYVNAGINNLRRDLLSGDTHDLGTHRSAEYHEGHSPSQFAGLSVDAYWVVSTKSVILLAKSPIRTHIDEEGRLHKKDGPAVEYEDGFEVWAWRGHVLKKDYILKPNTLPYDMHTDPNFDGLYWIEDYEYFYALAELVGYAYFYKHARKEVLDEDYDRKKKHRKLVKLRWGNYTSNHDDLHLLVLGDGKERAYLKVPEDLETCAQAVAWTFGKTVRGYQPIEET